MREKEFMIDYNYSIRQGDMVLYESHTVLHGRPFPLNGSFFVSPPSPSLPPSFTAIYLTRPGEHIRALQASRP